MAAPPPLAIIGGLIAGVITWNHMGDQYAKQDELAAQRNNQNPPEPTQQVAVAEPAVAASDGNTAFATSGN